MKFELDYVLLKRYTRERNLTYEELEKRMDINRKTICNTLNGKHTPTLDVLIRFFVVLKFTEDEIRCVIRPGFNTLKKILDKLEGNMEDIGKGLEL